MSENDDDFDWMASIPRTGDDQEIWACEGAIAELAYYRDHEATDEQDRAQTQAIIARLSQRHRQLVWDVRG